MIKVKICGITNKQDAFWASSLGADFIGLNFCKQSLRKVSIKNAKEIVQSLPPYTSAVGVFVDETLEDIIKTCKKTGIKIVQLHGNENTEFCKQLKLSVPELEIIKVIKVKQVEQVQNLQEYAEELYRIIMEYLSNVDYILFDTYIEGELGGTGEIFNWDVVGKIKEMLINNNINLKFFIAGGLTEENVEKVVELLSPWGVDVSSGVERLPRRKDFDKMKNFIRKVKNL